MVRYSCAIFGILLIGTASLATAQTTEPRPLPMTGEAKPDFAPFDDAMREFMNTRTIRAGTLAVLFRGELVLQRGYGWADEALTRPLPAGTRFRLAGVSEVLTRAAVRNLIGDGKLRLNAKAAELLSAMRPLAVPGDDESGDERILQITVEHLLDQQAGWDFTETFDPVLDPWRLAEALDLSGHPTPADLVRWLATVKLEKAPDEEHAYETPVNAVLLGEIVAVASGMSYEDAVRQMVLRPAGLREIAPGAVSRDGRARSESWYAHPQMMRSVLGDDPDAESPGAYGGYHFEHWRAAAGWIGSAGDTARLLDRYGPHGRKPEAHESWKIASGVPGGYAVAIWRGDGLRIVALFNQSEDDSLEHYDAIVDQLEKAANRVRRTLR